MTPPPLRVATWNLNRSAGADRQALLAEHRPHLLCAQEVTRSTHEELVASGLFDWSAFSLDFRPRPRGSRSERLGVAVLGVGALRLRTSGILPWLARPEKLVHVDVDVPGWGAPITVASYHASPGEGKPECTLQVAHWLELTFGPAILGLDANTPGVDHPDHERSLFHWQQAPFTRCEPALLGPPSQRRHRLEDVLRTWLAAHPDERDAIADARPEGPLAVTYDRSRRHDTHSYARFDSIWVTPELAVDSVQHLWDGTNDRPHGGSDHAMVVVDLVPPARTPRRPRQDVVDHLVEQQLVAIGTRFTLAVDLVVDPDDRAALEAWSADHPDARGATWTGDRARPLEWDLDGTAHNPLVLARHICGLAGVAFPGSPPGPHWWRDADGQNLVKLS